MERFFIIKDERLIDLYNKYYKAMIRKMNDCFREFAREYGIETDEYYMTATNLHIIPTENDKEKFGTYFKANSDGLFKKNSKIAKEWIKFCKENDVKTPNKPIWEMSRLMDAQFGVFENKFLSRIFDIDGVIYGSYLINRDWEITNTNAFQELKASEFWKIVEDAENSK